MNSESLFGIGQRLADARQSKGLSAADVAAQLKLSVRQVEALEAEIFTQLPGEVFVRGFVRNYARIVGLDPEALLPHVETHVPEQVTAPSTNMRFRTSPVHNWLLVPLIGAVLIFALVGLLYGWLSGDGEQVSETVAQPVDEQPAAPHALAPLQPVLLDPNAPADAAQPTADTASKEAAPQGPAKDAASTSAAAPVPGAAGVASVVPPAAKPPVAKPPVDAASAVAPAPKPAAAPVPVAPQVPAAPLAAPKPVPAPVPAPTAAPVAKPAAPAQQPAPAPQPSAKPPVTTAVPQPIPAATKPASPAPAQTPPVAPAVKPATEAPKPAGQNALVFQPAEDAWVQVVDAKGQRFSKLIRAGSSETISGVPPFKLVVGNAASVRLSHNGKSVDLKPFIGEKVARLSLE